MKTPSDDIISLNGPAWETEQQARVIAKAVTVIAEMLPPIIEALAETLRPTIKEIGYLMERIIDLYPNKRVLHLAKHGKKARTRKKNINRISKHFERESKKRAVFAQN